MIDVLIVEDNKEIAALTRDFLNAENYITSIAENGEQALHLFKKYGAKLVLLDVMLPGIDGFKICSEIRKDTNTPIIIVSARGEKEDKLKGLLTGADDYIEKPYDIDILLAKINGIFKRRYGFDEITAGNIIINREEKSVKLNGEKLELTSKEYELLLLLAENKGKCMKKDFLFNKIWGYDSFSEQQTLTVHIKRLRNKIEKNPLKPERIITVWGKGYKFL